MKTLLIIYILSFLICLFWGKKAESIDNQYKSISYAMGNKWNDKITASNIVIYLFPVVNTVKAIRTIIILSI
jgi:hypothetical protein